MASQGMTAGGKEDGPAVGHAGGKVLRPTGRAERIVFGADRQDRARDLLDRIRVVRGSRLDVELHPCVAPAYRQKVFQNLSQSRLLAGVDGTQNSEVCAEHHFGNSARHEGHQL